MALSKILEKPEAHQTAQNIKPALKDPVAKRLAVIATLPAESCHDAEALTIALKAGPPELRFAASAARLARSIFAAHNAA